MRNYLDKLLNNENYLDELLNNEVNHDLAVNWVNVEMLSRMNKYGINSFDDLPETLSSKNLTELLKLIESGIVNGRIAKDVLDKVFFNSLCLEERIYLTPREIVEKYGLAQVADSGAIEKLVDDVLSKNSDKVAEYKAGNDKLFGFFVREVMKASEAKANPEMVNKVLTVRLH